MSGREDEERRRVREGEYVKVLLLGRDWGNDKRNLVPMGSEAPIKI